jgi:hypothetical protein
MNSRNEMMDEDPRSLDEFNMNDFVLCAKLYGIA